MGRTRLSAFLNYWGWFALFRLPVPVLSVGKLTLGGTGEAPVVIVLTDWLLAQHMMHLKHLFLKQVKG